MRSWVLFAATLFLLFGAAALFVSILMRRIEGSVTEAVPGESLREVMSRVARDHVDPVDEEAVVYGAMKGLAAELDPHSRVFAPAEWVEFQGETRGEIDRDRDRGRVPRRCADHRVGGPEGPAARAGIRAGDRILEIAGGPVDFARPRSSARCEAPRARGSSSCSRIVKASTAAPCSRRA